MVDEKALSKEGEVTGEYELVVMSESGKAIAKTTFSIINSKYYPNVIIGNSDSSITSQNDNSLNSLTSESKLIPEWIRDIFTWYAEEKISEAELLDAIESLIKLKIIEV
jgi:NMD protein affecting ribosome stability and mRNA decay